MATLHYAYFAAQCFSEVDELFLVSSTYLLAAQLLPDNLRANRFNYLFNQLLNLVFVLHVDSQLVGQHLFRIQ